MSVARSRACADGTAYRPAHATGNKVLNRIVAGIFGDSMGDMLSGYRVFSRRFVKSFPAVSREFEIETELTVHSLALRIPSTTVPVDFRDRAEGSESKLRTYRDGWRILNVILSLTRHERPMYFFGLLAGALRPARDWRSALRCSSSTCRPAWSRSFPSLFVASFLLVISCLGLMAGLVLDGIRKSRHEASRLSYMRHPAIRDAYVTRPRHAAHAGPDPDRAPHPARGPGLQGLLTTRGRAVETPAHSEASMVAPRPTIITPPVAPSVSSRVGLRANQSRAFEAASAQMLSEQIAIAPNTTPSTVICKPDVT